MAEDLDDHRRTFDRGDDLRGAAEVRAVFHIDIDALVADSAAPFVRCSAAVARAGVLAPNAKLRSKIVPALPEPATETSSEGSHAQGAPPRMSWARLLKRMPIGAPGPAGSRNRPGGRAVFRHVPRAARGAKAAPLA